MITGELLALIADDTGTPRTAHSLQVRVLILLALCVAFSSVFLEQSPPALLIFSWAFQACILPAVAIPALILLSREMLMGPDQATPGEKAGIWAVILFSLMTRYYAVVELMQTFMS